MTVDTSFDLRAALAPVARLMRWNAGIRAGSRMLLGMSLVWLPACAVSKCVFLPVWFLPSLWMVGGIAVFAAAAAEAARGATLAAAARLADHRLSLKERLATVCELDDLHDQSEVSSLLRRDAAQHLGKVVARNLVALELPRNIRWALAALLLTGIVSVLPEFRSEKRMRQQAEREGIRAQGQRIELLARRITENPAILTHRETPEDLKKISDVGKRLSSGTLSKSDALRELTKLTDELKQREQSLQCKSDMKPLDRESWRERESFSPEQMQELQSQVDALQNELGKTPASEKQLRKLEKALKQIREAMKNAKLGASEGQAVADSLNQSLTDAESAQLSKVAEELRKAVAALEGAEAGQVLRHLDDAIVDLDQARQKLAALNQLMSQASKAGKDLAEQLERGQAKLAQRTLENLRKQADGAQLTPEERQQIANELMQALGPSRDYGNLSHPLQQAMNQAQAGDQPGLARSLQNAIQELDQLIQQQGQQMQLAQMINELERCGAMIAMGQCQGAAQQPGSCLGLNTVQKKAGGVGTWPDQGCAPTYSETWDNAGANRPDMASRGPTDRGEPSPPQGAQTMKLTGQMGSGGPMPGIRLQGISIKGESNLKIEEAFSAAAQEAENALTKETVPTSYQGAVKEYFDLK